MKTTVCKQQPWPEKSSTACECLCGFVVCVCVCEKTQRWILRMPRPKKEKKKNICQYFLSSVIVSIFFPPFQVLFLPDCVHLLIDNWLQSHSGLLKYQAEASGFRPRPQALLLSASGRLAPLEPIPVSPIQPACFVYLHLSRLPATHRAPARWGWQGVNTDKNMAVRKRDR